MPFRDSDIVPDNIINKLPMVSVIMPAYNASQHIQAAIESVINQSHERWELLIINDGSKDNTEDVVLKFRDDRISYFSQDNLGVSAARNVGLDNINGKFVCFLDADDVLSPDSLSSRVLFFQDNPSVDFVDGTIRVTEKNIDIVARTWKPSFRGVPTRELARLKDTCFATISWLIRADAIGNVRFRENLTHGEDLIFLVEISVNRLYDAVPTPILYFRRTGASAMSDLDGLARGYCEISRIFSELRLLRNPVDRSVHKFKIMKIMFLSYLVAGNTMKAFRFLLKGMMP